MYKYQLVFPLASHHLEFSTLWWVAQYSHKSLGYYFQRPSHPWLLTPFKEKFRRKPPLVIIHVHLQSWVENNRRVKVPINPFVESIHSASLNAVEFLIPGQLGDKPNRGQPTRILVNSRIPCLFSRFPRVDQQVGQSPNPADRTNQWEYETVVLS